MRLPGPRWCAFCPKCRRFVAEPCRSRLDLPIRHRCSADVPAPIDLVPVRMVPKMTPEKSK